MSSAPTPTQAEQALAALRDRFRAAMGNTLTAFEALATQLASSPGAPELLSALRRELHRVHGTAGSYGFLDASRLAAALEERALRWDADPGLDRPQRAAIVEHFVSALRLAIGIEDEGEGADLRLLLAGLPPDTADDLRAEATLRGYLAETVDAGTCTPELLRAWTPHVVITDLAHADALATAAGSAAVPLVVLDLRSRADRLLEERGLARRGPIAQGAADTVVVAGGEPSPVLDVVDRLTARSSLGGATVLVVDDDPSIHVIVRHQLERIGVRTVSLADPDRLLAAVVAERPSLVLVDLHLGAHDGLEVARQLRTSPGNRELPIIVFSTDAGPAARDAAHRAGADEFLPKPIVPAELRARVTGRLDRLRLRRLAEERHPGTGLPLPPRTARECALAFAAARRAGRTATVVALRADGAEPDGDEATAWLRETQRIALALTGRAAVAGYLDGLALHAVLDADGDTVTSLLEALAASRPADAPAWSAGVADAAAVGSGDWALVRQAAEEARDAARQEAPAAVRRWTPERSAAAPDVILVEDDPALSEMLQYALKAAGFSCRAYGSGPLALDALRRMHTGGRRPLLLLDVDLPGLDGHSLHDILRLERPGAFAVVFATVHGSEGEQIRAFQAGAVDFVVKPLSLRVLLAKIPVWLERAAHTAAA